MVPIRQHSRSFVVEPNGRSRSPFGSIFSSGPIPFPLSPSANLFNMLTRTGVPTMINDDESDAFAEFEPKNVTSNDEPTNRTSNATQQNNSTSSQPKTRSDVDKEADQDLLESAGLRSVSRPALTPSMMFPSRFHPNSNAAGSMVIVSSTNNLDSLPMGLPPFLPHPSQMLTWMGDRDTQQAVPSPLNPILRSILDNVMSNVLTSEGGKNKSAQDQQRPRLVAQSASLGESEEEQAGSEIADRWDEPLTMRHRQDEDSGATDEMPDFLQRDFQMGPISFMMDPRGGLDSGSIPIPALKRGFRGAQKAFGPRGFVHNHKLIDRSDNRRNDIIDDIEVNPMRMLEEDNISPQPHIGVISRILSAAHKSDPFKASDFRIIKNRSSESDDFLDSPESFDEDSTSIPHKSELDKGKQKFRVTKAKFRVNLVGPKLVPLIEKPNLDLDKEDSSGHLRDNAFVNGKTSMDHNLFTSPSSPLFGFPAPLAPSNLSNNHNGHPSSIEPAKPNARQGRAFTYHSNNEVATRFNQEFADPLAANNNKQEPISASDSMVQPKFMSHKRSPIFQPADIVMGRRLDDGPVFAGQRS